MMSCYLYFIKNNNLIYSFGIDRDDLYTSQQDTPKKRKDSPYTFPIIQLTQEQ